MVRTGIFWFVCALIVLILGPVFVLLGYIDKSKRTTDILALFWVNTLLFIASTEIDVRDGRRLKLYDQYIIVSNHLSYFDIFVLIKLLGKVPHFLAKKELFRIPIFGWCLRAASVIEIDRENPNIALKSIKSALRKGLHKPIVIYPEGTRSNTGKLQPFKKKGLKLLFKVGLPVIPIVVVGTREIMPKGSYIVRKGRVKVFVLEPIDVSERLRSVAEEDLIEEIRNRINSIVELYY
ncbi:MAG: lysophospholipid acyltransferase family protein [Thermosulfidibacteraceae bacterium]|jgi:1-acyl-sn-glycerol-3-phosphate acyltransferase